MWKTAYGVASCMHCRTSKQHIVYPNSEANTCIGIYLWSSPVPVLNHNASNNKRLVTLWYKDITGTITVWRNNNDSVQTNIITKEFDTSKHFRVSFFVVAIKINSFTTLACYTIWLRRQDLPNNWFERRLKSSVMFLSIFKKGISPG